MNATDAAPPDSSASRPSFPRWWALAGAYLLLIAHKPWALTTPQLWAEDGSIFLAQNDQLGARAIVTPFQGYLHLLPRLVAWAASRLTDAAAWPRCYNLAALLITLSLFARITSARLPLPGKPWLVLAFVLTAQTGEVLLNITNLQWLTAFFLVLQLFLTRPTTAVQRAGDLLLTFVTSLTGPFALLLLPLFAGRWWHDRHRDNLALLLVIGAGAAVQAGFILATPGVPDATATPLHPLMLLAVFGSRLIVWPIFGRHLAETLPVAALAALGGTIFAAIAISSLRPHPRRDLRAQILVILVLLCAAGLWRVRPDTWETAGLVNGDRYFFIPRVLLAWLLIWEFHAQPRAIAYAARGLCLLGVLLELPRHMEPAPPDYHWAERCDPIRRGVPANIPTLPEGWTLEYPGRPPSR